jgi:hypothetical protein
MACRFLAYSGFLTLTFGVGFNLLYCYEIPSRIVDILSNCLVYTLNITQVVTQISEYLS